MRRFRIWILCLAVAAVVGVGQALVTRSCSSADGESAPARVAWPEPEVRPDPVTGVPPVPEQGDVVVPRRHLFLGPEKPWRDGR